MSSYLNIYGRLKKDLYEVKRLRDTEYHKQDDVILLDSYSRCNKLYQIVEEVVNPKWAGDEEVYTKLDSNDINNCINECKTSIENYQKLLKGEETKQGKYIEYLHSCSKILNYSEFLTYLGDSDNDEYIEEIKDDIEEYKHCLSILEILSNFITSCNLECNGFSEVLCNIN